MIGFVLESHSNSHVFNSTFKVSLTRHAIDIALDCSFVCMKKAAHACIGKFYTLCYDFHSIPSMKRFTYTILHTGSRLRKYSLEKFCILKRETKQHLYLKTKTVYSVIYIRNWDNDNIVFFVVDYLIHNTRDFEWIRVCLRVKYYTFC